MLWTLYAVLCLLVGLAALGLALLSDLSHGWAGMEAGLRWLVWLLPLVSLLSLVLLGGIAAKLGLRWTYFATLVVFVGTVQFALMLIWDVGRATMSFMPLVLIALSCAAFRPAVLTPLVAGIQHVSPLLGVIGLLAVAASGAARLYQHREAEQSRAVYAAQEAHRDAALHGLERAAWLLSREFSTLNESDFIRTQSYRPPGLEFQYRWDPGKERLILTVELFSESWRREQILPFASQALETQALRPGRRPDLDGGVLACTPPMECTVTWEFDVEPMHPYSGALRPSYKGIEVRAWQELSGSGK